MIITLDGKVATGKSTIAKMVAEAIGFIYFDTGAMYRALTYGLLKKNVSIEDAPPLQYFLESFTFDIKNHKGHRRYFFEQEDISEAIRGEKVTSIVSSVSALRPVREKLVAIQREMAVGINAVFEGRDMGTVVFPQATLKVFLTGDSAVRAKRRYEELVTKFPEEKAHLSLESCLAEIEKRDALDSTRENSPLREPEGALVIDTTLLSPKEVVKKILDHLP